MSKKLNIGCGEDYREGYINCDIRKNVKKDKYFNLNDFPYPFQDNEIDLVYMKNVLLYFDEPIKILKELARIVKKGGKIIIINIHALSYGAISDTGSKSMKFTENSFSEKSLRDFEIEKILMLKGYKFTYTSKWKKYIPLKRILKIFIRGIYDYVEFEFEVIK